MTDQQLILFAILAAVFVLLIWGRYRYDLVAFAALLAGLLSGVVPSDQAFSGFGNPATVIIALVLIVSRGLSNSGAIDLLAKHLAGSGRGLSAHIGLTSGLAATLSAVMNNVGALALLMPAEIKAAIQANRSPGLTLMPLSFATILGGLATMIGTPPNIIVAAYSEEARKAGALTQAFSMFSFTPVGGACAVVGVIFVAAIGWRLIPTWDSAGDARRMLEIDAYVAELKIPEGSESIGRQLRDLDEAASEAGAEIIGLVRRGKRLPGMARTERIGASDLLVVKAGPEAIDRLVGVLKLEYLRGRKQPARWRAEDIGLTEAVVPETARIAGRSALSLGLLYRHGVTLVGVSRQGKPVRDRVRKMTIRAGDVLLLLGPAECLGDIVAWLGCLPLADRGVQIVRRDKAWMTVGIFVAAILAAGAGLVDLPVALACAAAVLVLLGIVPPRQIYESVEWPAIVLLGSMIPLGAAMEGTGATGLISGGLVDLAQGWPAWAVLTVLMVVTVTLSDVMNNTATTVIAAPIAVDVAVRMNVDAAPFLMAVAVAASCAFLTPIGHKNNTLIMGPGGYRFGDYWRMGLPLEILVIAVAVPLILVVWPL